MASDDAYAAFLEKANADPSAGRTAQAATAGSASTAASAPAALVVATKDAFYMSDSDEPFEAVAVPYTSTSLPDEETFLKLAGINTSPDAVSILDPYDWDIKGHYTALLDAVRTAGHGSDVRVYRVELPGGSTRVEYWLVTVDEDGSGTAKTRVVGVKAKAVES